MTDKAPLARKLSTLAGKDVFVGKALRLGPSAQPQSISLVLQAIDDTMLERDVAFSVGDSSVTLRVSGKRVQMLISATDDLAAPNDLLQTPLSSGTPKAIAQLGEVLQRFTATEGVLLLERKQLADPNLKAGNGLGVQTLGAQWKASLLAPKIEPMDLFLKNISPRAIALVALRDGEIDSTLGDAGALDHLERMVAEEWQAFDQSHAKFVPDGETPDLRVLDCLGPAGQAVLVSTIDSRQCVALLWVDAVPQAVAAWAVTMSASAA